MLEAGVGPGLVRRTVLVPWCPAGAAWPVPWWQEAVPPGCPGRASLCLWRALTPCPLLGPVAAWGWGSGGEGCSLTERRAETLGRPGGWARWAGQVGGPGGRGQVGVGPGGQGQVGVGLSHRTGSGAWVRGMGRGLEVRAQEWGGDREQAGGGAWRWGRGRACVRWDPSAQFRPQ